MGVLINVRGENMYIKKFNRINLSGNEQYLEVLRALEDRAEYIEIRHNNEEVSESFSNYLRYLEENKDEPECMKTLKEVKENLNLGVASFALENLQRVWTYHDDIYRFKADKTCFEFLRRFESFFINESYYDESGDLCYGRKFTDFGIDEVRFFDICNNKLFISNAIRGTAKIREDVEVDKNIIEIIKPDFYDLCITSHEQHLELLRALEGRTRYIELVQVDEVVNFALDNMILLEKGFVNEWEGTRAVRYKFESNKVFFEFLRRFEAFFINEEEGVPFREMRTDFGIDDICFFDEKNKMLFWTTTHEGYGTAIGQLDLNMDIMREFPD